MKNRAIAFECSLLSLNYPVGARTVGEVTKECSRTGYPGRRFAAAPLRSALGYHVIAPSGRNGCRALGQSAREANATRTRQRPLWQQLLAARKTESGYEERCFRRTVSRSRTRNDLPVSSEGDFAVRYISPLIRHVRNTLRRRQILEVANSRVGWNRSMPSASPRARRRTSDWMAHPSS